MFIKTRILSAMSGLFFATHVYALNISIPSPVEHVLPTTSGKKQTIILQQFNLSDLEQQAISKHLHKKHRLALTSDFLPRSIQLGMNGLPVLNQGQHGTCATFAVTAAIDATLNRGAYTSQLCLLRLGQYLERTNWLSSGWNGLGGAILVLDRIKQYGIISLENQQRYGCGGIFTYPLKDTVPDGEMSLKTYNLYHESLSSDQITWSFLWSRYGFLFENNSVNKIRRALNKGNRVTVILILPRIYLGIAGATGKHHVADDTWVLTREIENSLDKTMEGHNMVITGYDDQAVAVDRNGDLHRGLFTLRNSWGPEVGDEGDFYVSYDYLEGLAIEAIQIGPA